MKLDLDVLSFATAGVRNLEFPSKRICPLPKPSLHPRKPRLPGLASAMALQSLEGQDISPDTAVFFGTGLGSSTETEAFVENMIRQNEATPMPRAFSASVHNSAASRIAIALKARGPSITFVHGETSFAQALLVAGCWRQRGGKGPAITGSADEFTPYIRRARDDCNCTVDETAAEGGAVFLCGVPSVHRPALARFRSVHLGQTRDLRAWMEAHLPPEEADLVLVALPTGASSLSSIAQLPQKTVVCHPWTGEHPSSPASATAMAVGLICGELQVDSLCPAGRPRAVSVLATTRFQDVSLITLEAAS